MPDQTYSTYLYLVGAYLDIISNLTACLSDTFPSSEPPFFVRSPQNVSVLSGRDAFLDCAAGGEPSPETTWTFKGKPLDPERTSSALGQDRSGDGVTLRRVRPEDSGVYVCRATSDVGTVFARAEVYVQEAPVITARPR